MKMEQFCRDRGGLLPTVPDWVIGWAFPEFEADDHTHVGVEYLKELSHHRVDNGGRWRAEEFVVMLTDTGLIRKCMNFHEGKVLTNRGRLPEFFEARHLLLWRSIAYDNCGNYFVPFIQNIPDQPSCIQPIIYWYWLEYFLYGRQRTYLFEDCP